MVKSKVEFQVVRPPSSREVALKPEKSSHAPWIQAAAAGGLGIISTAALLAGFALPPAAGDDTGEKLARLGAERVLASLTADRSLLEGQAGILAEDPRLKSTLATEGIDAASISDILADVNKTAGIQMSAILNPEGRVFASSGNRALEGMDLKSSELVRNARPGRPTSDSWVLESRLVSVSFAPISVGDRRVAVLLLGRTFDESVVQDAAKVSETTGAMFVGGKVVSEPITPEYTAAFFVSAGLPNGPVRALPEFSGYVAGVGEGEHAARLMFLNRKQHNPASQAAAWIPAGALFVFAGISLVSKLKKGN